MNIGIFDSGRGGRFVTEKLRALLPEHNYTTIDDSAHAPYGERDYDDIRRFTEAAIQPILDKDLIIVACNTATAAAIDDLRAKYPDKAIVGFEPMIKPAAKYSKNRHITLLATKATANSKRTNDLIAKYAPDVIIDRINTIDWAHKIDQMRTDEINLDEVATSIASGSDSIIIGCTHYIDLMPRLEKLFPNIKLFEPSEAIARRISSLIEAKATAQPQ